MSTFAGPLRAFPTSRMFSSYWPEQWAFRLR